MKSRTAAKPGPATSARGQGAGNGSGGADEGVFLPYGATHTIALDLPEFRPLMERLELPPPSPMSPLPALMAPGTKGTIRDVDEILGRLARQDQDTLTWMFSPLAIPDRILDLRGGIFNGAPQLCRLYSNRLFPDFFAGLRPALATDYELLAPFTRIDLDLWTRLQTQLSGGNSVPAPLENPTGAELAFLLLLADAHKSAFARSWTERQEEPTPVSLSASDILAAQDAAASSPDRRWAAQAVGELFGAMIHPGGATGVGLPRLDARAIAGMIQGFADRHMLTLSGSGREQRFELDTTLGMWAGSIFTWVNLMSLHDTQVVAFEGGRLKAQDECLILITAQSAVWAIASNGLGSAGGDLGGVKFTLRSVSVPQACSLVAKFIEPLPGVTLPDQVYHPLGSAPAPGPATTNAVPPRRGRKPVWAPTHVVPEGGLDAWDRPDPNLEPVAELDAGLEVQVTNTDGAWAHIICDNGWEGWTDGRELNAI